MKTATVLTTTTLEGVKEAEELTRVSITVKSTNKEMPSVWNPYFKKYWGDFKWLRSQFSGLEDIRCYATTSAALRKVKIKGHIGMYDLTDNDGILDFYIGIPVKLDKRAKANGFKTNFAWLFCHEYLHGREQLKGSPDRVHEMEKQGRLKELLKEYRLDDMQADVSTLQKILASLVGMFSTKPTLKPRVQRACDAIVREMDMLGHPVRVVQGYRSIQEQDKLYAQGRTTPGSIVTNAKGGQSYHNYGVAVDFVFRKEGYNASSTLWETLGHVGKNQGFEWGGDWKGFVDRPHFEMKLGYSLSDFQQGKIDWSKYQ